MKKLLIIALLLAASCASAPLEKPAKLHLQESVLLETEWQNKPATPIPHKDIVVQREPPESPTRPSNGIQRDRSGKEIIYGPVPSGFYTNVHIISQSVGVEAYGPTSISDSVIEAPVCVSSSGQWLSMTNNQLYCGLCIEYAPGPVVGNTITNNICSGRWSNRN